jgi:hypothetical protein
MTHSDNPRYFTPEQAFEASDDGQPILIEDERACQIIEEHGADATAFYVEYPHYRYNAQFDAADLFAWLGY